MPKKKYIIEPEESLAGSLTVSPWELFNYKKAYKNKDSKFDSGQELLDIRDGRQHYGKIDFKKDFVYPSEEFLLPIGDKNNPPLFVINFVAKAFRELKKYMRRAALRKRVSIEKSEMFLMTPLLAWEPVHPNYHAYMDNIYLSFYNFFLQRDNNNQKIKDFKSFLDVFLPFIKNLTRQFDVCYTMSGFISSKACSPMIGGLMIDIYSGNCNNDIEKRKKFLEDPNFEFYRNTVKKFGFVIDKDIPWRLVADLSSSAMKKQLYKSGLKYEEVFEEYYYSSYNYDLDLMKKYLVIFYNSVVSASPVVKYSEFCAKKNRTVTKVIIRPKISNSEADELFSLEDWIKLYIDIRKEETNSRLSDEDRMLLVRDARRMKGKVDIYNIMGYINNAIRKNSRVNQVTFKQEAWPDFPPPVAAMPIIAKNVEGFAAIAGLDLSTLNLFGTEDSEE